MSNIIAEIFKDEIAAAAKEAAEKTAEETKQTTLIENIRSMMKKLNLTAQQAMDILEIPANEQNKYFNLI